MKKFVTIKEAGVLTGKAEITIRRLIKRLLTQNEPETKQVIRQTKSSSGYQYQIDTEFLLKKLGMDYLLNNHKDNQETKPEDTQDSQQNNHKANQIDKVPETKAEMGGHEICLEFSRVRFVPGQGIGSDAVALYRKLPITPHRSEPGSPEGCTKSITFVKSMIESFIHTHCYCIFFRELFHEKFRIFRSRSTPSRC